MLLSKSSSWAQEKRFTQGDKRIEIKDKIDKRPNARFKMKIRSNRMKKKKSEPIHPRI